MRKIYAIFTTLLITIQASTVALPARAQVKYGSVGGWTIQINGNGSCVIQALFERGSSFVYGHLNRHEGFIYADWSWKLPNNTRYALDLVFSDNKRIPVVGTSYVSAGISGVQVPFQNTRLITLLRSASDMQILNRESGKVVAHIALKDLNKAYASWLRCEDMYH